MGTRLLRADNKDVQVELYIVDEHLKDKAGYYTRLQGHRAPSVRICTMSSSGKWVSPGVGPCVGVGGILRLR